MHRSASSLFESIAEMFTFHWTHINGVRSERLLNYTSHKWPGSEQRSGRIFDKKIITPQLKRVVCVRVATVRDTAFFLNVRMNLATNRSCAAFYRCRTLYASRQHCVLFSTANSYFNVLGKPLSKQRHKKIQRVSCGSWEERLADVVTPLWRHSYEEQLDLKQKQQEKILCQLCGYLSDDFQPQAPSHLRNKLTFPVLPILPSPVRDGYRNKSTFSVNRGIDGNPKTVGFYTGTGKKANIVCVNGDHLLNMPEKHKLIARCYQDFIRLSPLEPCLLFHSGGHWREITVRTNREGHTMAIVYFHPQTLSPEEIAAHKADLVDYFTLGPGSVCQLDSLFFQESTMTRTTHEKSPYQLLHGQPHIYEEVIYAVSAQECAVNVQESL